MELDQDFWTNRYKQDDIGWDTACVTRPLQTYFDQIKDKNVEMLIPGGGNAYEAEYLFKHGFTNVYALDFSEVPLQNLQKRCPDFPSENLIRANFFEHKGEYDLIVEQTFFCAINPALRMNYVKKIHELLKPKGKLVGLLFDVPFNGDEPPFGGCMEDYQKLFEGLFEFKYFETCYNSIEPRKNTELFICLTKK
jgi:SAM-dependent methyltransferase